MPPPNADHLLELRKNVVTKFLGDSLDAEGFIRKLTTEEARKWFKPGTVVQFVSVPFRTSNYIVEVHEPLTGVISHSTSHTGNTSVYVWPYCPENRIVSDNDAPLLLENLTDIIYLAKSPIPFTMRRGWFTN